MYIKDYVSHNCIKITSNVQKLEPISDGFVQRFTINLDRLIVLSESSLLGGFLQI